MRVLRPSWDRAPTPVMNEADVYEQYFEAIAGRADTCGTVAAKAAIMRNEAQVTQDDLILR